VLTQSSGQITNKKLKEWLVIIAQCGLRDFKLPINRMLIIPSSSLLGHFQIFLCPEFELAFVLIPPVPMLSFLLSIPEDFCHCSMCARQCSLNVSHLPGKLECHWNVYPVALYHGCM
jgi:hypothetical protein